MTKKVRTNKEYEALGKMLSNIYDSGYIDHGTSYKQSFLKGLASGFGGVIGATIVVGLLLWILSAFKQVPLVGPFVDTFRSSVQQKR